MPELQPLSIVLRVMLFGFLLSYLYSALTRPQRKLCRSEQPTILLTVIDPEEYAASRTRGDILPEFPLDSFPRNVNISVLDPSPVYLRRKAANKRYVRAHRKTWSAFRGSRHGPDPESLMKKKKKKISLSPTNNANVLCIRSGSSRPRLHGLTTELLQPLAVCKLSP